MECNKEMRICIILCQNTECRTQLCYKPFVVLSQHARICHVRLKDIAQGWSTCLRAQVFLYAHKK